VGIRRWRSEISGAEVSPAEAASAVDPADQELRKLLASIYTGVASFEWKLGHSKAACAMFEKAAGAWQAVPQGIVITPVETEKRAKAERQSDLCRRLSR
jgi:hypothetical protein